MINKDGWISVDDAIPNIGKKVETAQLIDGVISQICENGLDIHFHCCSNYTLFCYKWIIPYYNPTHWREIIEKRPDFSKLNEGDLIVMYFEPTYYEDRNYYCGIFKEISNDRIRIGISKYYINSSDDGFELSEIKKITRINIEEQTFEEI